MVNYCIRRLLLKNPERDVTKLKINTKKMSYEEMLKLPRLKHKTPRKPSKFLGKFDMIVSNPPYITGPEMLDLPASVDDYEPHLALYGGEDGLDFYRSIAENYTATLKEGGYLCLEYDPSQGNAICCILEDHGYRILDRVRDFNDRERALLAQLVRKEEK